MTLIKIINRNRQILKEGLKFHVVQSRQFLTNSDLAFREENKSQKLIVLTTVNLQKKIIFHASVKIIPTKIQIFKENFSKTKNKHSIFNSLQANFLIKNQIIKIVQL